MQAVDLCAVASLPAATIARRYRELASVVHPDKWSGPGDTHCCMLSACLACFCRRRVVETETTSRREPERVIELTDMSLVYAKMARGYEDVCTVHVCAGASEFEHGCTPGCSSLVLLV
jgi:hypothetical protein